MQDYDGSSQVAREFYQRTQAKLVYAVTSHTPAEIIATRANADKPNMGLRTWEGDEIRKSDATVAKNYLAETEIRELNRLTTILLDIFEDQLEQGRLVVMADATRLLDQQLAQLGRVVLRSGGSVSADDAKRRAEGQYEHFNETRRLERHRQADEHIAELTREAKSLPRTPRGRT